MNTRADQPLDSRNRHQFFYPCFLERDEALRRAPREPYAWDDLAEVRPFGAMEENIVEGVY